MLEVTGTGNQREGRSVRWYEIYSKGMMLPDFQEKARSIIVGGRIYKSVPPCTKRRGRG